VIGKNIREIRLQIPGMSQEKLALILGVGRTTVVNWETNISSPNIIMLRKLKVVLNCTYDELLDEQNTGRKK